MDKLVKMDNGMKLSDLKAPVVLEVMGGEVITTVHGRASKALCRFQRGGKVEQREIIMPTRCVEEVTDVNGIVKTGLFVYLGQQEPKKPKSLGNAYHNMKYVLLRKGETIESKAAQLRHLNEEELRAVFQIDSFSAFAEGTIFVCQHVQEIVFSPSADKKPAQTTPIMDYETVIDGATVRGQIYLPPRILVEMKKQKESPEAVMLLYRGSRTSSSGRVYFDIAVLDEQKSAQMLKAHKLESGGGGPSGDKEAQHVLDADAADLMTFLNSSSPASPDDVFTDAKETQEEETVDLTEEDDGDDD